MLFECTDGLGGRWGAEKNRFLKYKDLHLNSRARFPFVEVVSPPSRRIKMSKNALPSLNSSFSSSILTLAFY